ncbi:MAG: hypothetical protein ACXADH_17455 [Candidatus Kariarchaeaceae archaeon]|jgi:hypothetical protein
MTNLIQQKQIEGLGGGALTPANHRPLDQLVHNIAETSYEELTYTGNQLDSVIIWTNSGKTVKIRETSYTYSGSRPATETIIQYDGAGAVITGETLTGTYTYSGNKLDNIDWVLL